MSLYEILAVVALAAVGGFAFHLYRSDTKAGRGTPPASGAANRSMFGRDRGGKR